MIDIEFIVQYLVLRHACRHPELTANTGNIALLHRAGELGLVDVALADAAADAYRDFRRLQHQVRLQGQDSARVDPAMVADDTRAVIQLWQQCLEPPP
jgi:glutamate-ammonia-ligase adenylyltransferase